MLTKPRSIQPHRTISPQVLQQALVQKCLGLCAQLREAAIREGDVTTAERMTAAIAKLQAGHQ